MDKQLGMFPDLEETKTNNDPGLIEEMKGLIEKLNEALPL